MNRKITLLVLALVVILGASQASAAVVGTLTENACGGGGVTVTATTITWLPPSTLANYGCIITGSNTNLTWSGGGSMGPGVTGAIQNLTAGGPSTVDAFMLFPVPSPALDFVLTSIGPGSPNAGQAACAAANTNGASCSVVANSPFILTYINGDTSISLSARGTIADPNAPGDQSSWSGAFAVTVAGQTPLEVYNTFVSQGFLTTGNQGQFRVSALGIPEPSTLSIIFIGGGLLAVAFRKRKTV